MFEINLKTILARNYRRSREDVTAWAGATNRTRPERSLLDYRVQMHLSQSYCLYSYDFVCISFRVSRFFACLSADSSPSLLTRHIYVRMLRSLSYFRYQLHSSSRKKNKQKFNISPRQFYRLQVNTHLNV